jgi:hypothetical protein
MFFLFFFESQELFVEVLLVELVKAVLFVIPGSC